LIDKIKSCKSAMDLYLMKEDIIKHLEGEKPKKVKEE